MKLAIEKKMFQILQKYFFSFIFFDTFIGERDSVKVKVPRGKLSTLS
jgi:hypothetical protein